MENIEVRTKKCSKCGRELPASEFSAKKYAPDGARWRINSVWHKPSAYGNELKTCVDVIVKTDKGYRFGIFNAVGFYNEHLGFVSASGIEYALSEVLEYAYLSDLLPERKEESK